MVLKHILELELIEYVNGKCLCTILTREAFFLASALEKSERTHACPCPLLPSHFFGAPSLSSRSSKASKSAFSFFLPSFLLLFTILFLPFEGGFGCGRPFYSERAGGLPAAFLPLRVFAVPE